MFYIFSDINNDDSDEEEISGQKKSKKRAVLADSSDSVGETEVKTKARAFDTSSDESDKVSLGSAASRGSNDLSKKKKKTKRRSTFANSRCDH